MNRNEWEHRLTNWFKQHPLRSPSSGSPQSFRDEVMARIRAEHARARRPFWGFEPRWGFALGGLVAAGIAVMLILPSNRLPGRNRAQPVEETATRMVVAEATPAAWADFETDLELLEALEEEDPATDDRVTDEELLQELQEIDEAEMVFS